MANYWQKRAYAELSTEPNDLAKRGLVYLLSQSFNISGNSTVAFALQTNGVEVQFEFYDLVTVSFPVEAELREGATFTEAAPTLTGRNLNRNFSDSHTATLTAATNVSGGVKIASELMGAGNRAGGDFSTNRVHVLKDDTDYVMTFENLGNQTTRCHINLGWSEGEPDRYDLVREGINSGGVT